MPWSSDVQTNCLHPELPTLIKTPWKYKIINPGLFIFLFFGHILFVNALLISVTGTWARIKKSTFSRTKFCFGFGF